jgi:hypothetical protein
MNNNYIWQNAKPLYIYSKGHEDVSFPNNNTICRYCTFSNYIDLLTSKKLHLTKITNFEDKYEGFAQYESYYKSLDKSIVNVGNEYLNERIKNARLIRNSYYASCWFAKNNESYLMWKTYSKLDEGILIYSTIQDLIDSIIDKSFEKSNGEIQKIFYGEIDYGFKKDYKTEHLCSFGKHNIFEDEKEFRIVIYHHPIIDNNYIHINIDVKKVINKIIIAPFATDAFREHIIKISKENNISENIIKFSEIAISEDDAFNRTFKNYL